MWGYANLNGVKIGGGTMEKKYHHGDLKTQLISKGLMMIHTEGVGNLSLRKLAKMCEVSEAAPYSHFKNKEELLAAMSDYVSERLLECVQNAYESSEDTEEPRAIYNIGKAYIFFFLEHPEYFSFLFHQSDAKINLTISDAEDDFAPYRFFKEKAYQIYRQKGLDDEKIKYGIISEWATVHGLASIATIKGVQKDFEWEDVLDQIILG